MEIPNYVKNCITHHNACDCREYYQKEEVAKLQKANAIYQEALDAIKAYEIKDESDGWIKDMVGVTLLKVKEMEG